MVRQAHHDPKTFFQSRIFGEFQEKIPYRGKSWMLICHSRLDRKSIDPRFRGDDTRTEDDTRIAASCLVIKMKLPLGFSWLWIPYGPLGFREEIFEDLARVAQEERAIFARIEPPSSWEPHHTTALSKKWRVASTQKRFTPENSLVLDLEKSEGDLLKEMKPKGRYNIAVAKKHGVKIQSFSGAPPEGDFDAFYKLLKDTAKRDGFGIHPKFFYQTLLETFGENSKFFLAYKFMGGVRRIIGGAIVIFFNNTATYYYGASSYADRNLMATYLLQWEAILEAKRRGMHHYDFLGIAPDGALRQAQSDKTRGNRHPWVGVTEFKKKFGGREVVYSKAFDIIYHPLLYRLMSLRAQRSSPV